MNYPLISEYIEAIKVAEDNFAQLKHLRQVLGDDGLPIMTSGNFAVVFKMEDPESGKFYAVKCFTKEQEGRAEAYKLIAEELAKVDSPYILSVSYLEKELFVDTMQTDEIEFPVLLMDWVEGKTLDKYLRENLADKYALEMLAYRFSQLAQWLIPQPFAHGDLKPDNILVREDGTLVLVDYDGMYVPAMKGQKARELGSPDFRHPLRSEADFDEHIDDFSLLILTLSVLVACNSPQYYSFPFLTDKDYINPTESPFIKKIYPSNNPSLNRSVSTLINVLVEHETTLSITAYNAIAKHIRWDYYNYAQNYYDLLKEQCIDYHTFYERFHRKGSFDENSKHYPVSLATAVDKVDVEYEYPYAYNYNHSFYKGILLHASDIYEYSYLGEPYAEFWIEMSLPSDTIVIGKEALSDCSIVELIVVPNSVKYIGDKAFYNCENLRYIVFPESIEGFGTDIFSLKDSYVNSITGNTDTQHYGKGAHSLINIIVPDGAKEYYANLLPDYRHLIVDFSEIANSKDPAIKSLFVKSEKIAESENGQISTTVTDEDLSNAWTDEYGVKYSVDRKRLLKAPKNMSIKEYTIKDGTIVICDWAFSCFIDEPSELVSVKIPNSITHIGKCAFEGCKLKSLFIPNSATFIADNAFSNCSELVSIRVENNNRIYDSRNNCNAIVQTLDNKLILGCGETVIPDNIALIGDDAFSNCLGITSLAIPNSVTSIGKRAFFGCFNLTSVTIPSSVISIGDSAFSCCRGLKGISFANVKHIGREAFCLCTDLQTVILPKKSVSMGQEAFSGCRNLNAVYILDEYPIYEANSFKGCPNIEFIFSNSGVIYND